MGKDDLNLKMQNQGRLERNTCPKCNSIYKPGEVECRNCGIIFEKFNSTISKNSVDARQLREPAPEKATTADISPSQNFSYYLPLIIVIGVLILGSGFVYFKLIESRVDAGKIVPVLTKFCTETIKTNHEDSVSDDEEPFRTGKVLIVSPEQMVTLAVAKTGRPVTVTNPAQIHPAWHKLKRNVRARTPEDVDTLIRIYKYLGKSRRYGKLKTKVYSTHKIILKIYDWKNRTYIGTKIFDPGEGSSFMTEEDYEALSKLTSDETIADYIANMSLDI